MTELRSRRNQLILIVVALLAVLLLLGFWLQNSFSARISDLEKSQNAQQQEFSTELGDVKNKINSVTVDDREVGGDVAVVGGGDTTTNQNRTNTTQNDSTNVSSDVGSSQNGARGENGADGTSGTNGSDGAVGQTGPQGPSGVAACPNGNCLSLQGSSPGTQEPGSVNISGDGQFGGTVSAGSFSGDGANVTNVDATTLAGQNSSYYQNANNINSGTLSDGQLSSNVTLQGNTFNGASQLVQLSSGGILPMLDGSQLTNVLAANAMQLGGQASAYYLNASNLNAGTLSDSLLSTNVTLQGNTFNGANQLVKLASGGGLPILDGSQLTNVDAQTLNGQLAAYYLNASNINGGTLADARLSANVALKNATNTFTGTNNFAGLTATGILQNGFSVCSANNNCNYAAASGGAGYIQNGTVQQTASFNVSGNGYIDGSVGIGTTATSYKLDVAGNARINDGLNIGTNVGYGVSQNVLNLLTGGHNNYWTLATCACGGGSSTLQFKWGGGITNQIHHSGRISGADALATNEFTTLSQLNSATSGSLIQGGNSFGATATLGTNDNNSLAFETNGTTKFTLTAAGVLQGNGSSQISNPGSGSGSELFGLGAATSGNTSLSVGNGSTTNHNATAIGYQASAGAVGSTALGFRANSAGTNGISIGNASVSGSGISIGTLASNVANNVVIGHNAFAGAGQYNVVLGGEANVTGNSVRSAIVGRAANGGSNSVALGEQSQAASSSIAIGQSAQTTAANQLVIGSATTPISQGYIGNGVTAASPQGFTLSATGGSGTNIAGADLLFAGGRGTGVGAGGDIVLQTASAGGSGSILNPLTERLRIGSGGVNSISGDRTGVYSNLVVGSVQPSKASLVINNAAGNAFLSLTGAGDSIIQSATLSNAATNLRFFNGGTENMRISSVGNVGIGTSNPGSKLHVNGSTASTTGQIIQGVAGQTADLLQVQNSAGTVLSKIDASGNLTVKRADIQGDYISFSNNIRGYNTSVTAATTTKAVTFGTAHPDANYAVLCTPNWNTTCFVSGKTTTGFTLNFGTAAPAGQLVDWFVAR